MAMRAKNMVLAAIAVAAPAFAGDFMPPAQQTALVQKYCAVCHTDAARNGGLTLEHYNAARPDPALAAMLLSKLQNGAMGAAGLGVPDNPTQQAWVAATTAQAEGAKNWTVIRDQDAVSASIVRYVAPRKKGDAAPIYRLTLSCDAGLQLTWSPAPQTDRAFTVSEDGGPGRSYRLEGKEQMGNGAAGVSGRASAKLNALLDGRTLAVSDIFPGEQVSFPIGDLDPAVRRQLSSCLPGASN